MKLHAISMLFLALGFKLEGDVICQVDQGTPGHMKVTGGDGINREKHTMPFPDTRDGETGTMQDRDPPL
jgi:hypothetical protein